MSRLLLSGIAVLVGLTFSAASPSNAASEALLNQIEAEIAGLQPEFPIRGDKSTVITGAHFDRESQTILYLNLVELRVAPDALMYMMREIKVPHICEEYEDLLRQGIALAYHWRATDGRQIGMIRVGQRECGY